MADSDSIGECCSWKFNRSRLALLRRVLAESRVSVLSVMSIIEENGDESVKCLDEAREVVGDYLINHGLDPQTWEPNALGLALEDLIDTISVEIECRREGRLEKWT